MKLKLQDVSFGYKRKDLFQNIDLSICAGEIVAIVGQNGCGKTTLLKLIGDFLKPRKGSISIENDEKERNELCSGVLENPVFWNYMTGIENLQYYLGKDYSQDEIDKYAEKWNLSHMLNKTVKQYSLGMKQKLALILAFVSSNPIMLLDEPTNALDQPSVEFFVQCMKEAKQKGKIVIIATHIIYELTRYCDRIYLMKDGNISSYKHIDDEYTITYETKEDALEASKIIKDDEIIYMEEMKVYVKPNNRSISEIVKETAACNIVDVKKEQLTFDKICEKTIDMGDNYEK